MTSSVVLSTYNGAPYIMDLLLSLYHQTMKIDEVIIIDDCSGDGTVKLVKSFIDEHKLTNWIIKVNLSNQGWKVNFFEAMKLASSDLIFPCDQDDIWHKDKVEVMSNIMEKNKKIMLLEGKPHKFYERTTDNKYSMRMWIGVILDRYTNKKNICNNTRELVKKEFDVTFMKRAPGCTLAIRRDYFDSIKNLWFREMPHDALMTYFSNIQGVYYTYDAEVIEWRQHVGSASRSKERNKRKRMEELDLDGRMIESMLAFATSHNVSSDVVEIIQSAGTWNDYRKQLVKNNEWMYALKLLKYRRYYIQFRRYFTDIKYGMDNK